MFFNLVLIILISNVFLGPFVKNIIFFQFHSSFKTLDLFFMLVLILILLIFLDPFTKLIFLFNFTLQSNIKFILFFNFNPHSFNCYFFNPFI
jgi:hypothetical protein